MKSRIIVGATGASGLPLLIECLKMIREDGNYESCLIMSESARITLRHETNLTEEEVYALADDVFEPEEIGAGPASGTYRTAGMLVVPCSMKTLAGIHSGYADNLLLRAADVTLKEQRMLVLAVRETPLSPIHLRNMQELSMIPGVRIIPPMLTYYIRPQSVEEMTFHSAAKLLEPFGMEVPDYRRWKGL
ncbi:MAG: UbiX family flavin prenyltransferase [Bariatricus sp.]